MKSKSNTYIVGVSGGIDSCVLLHMIYTQHEIVVKHLGNDPSVIVAHVQHGMRETAGRDQEFVRSLAQTYGYTFETYEANLGPDASEEDARDARYSYFELLKNKYHAKAIVLAHHKNDVVETAVINMIRGTGRKGLTSLKSSSDRLRPLLSFTKQQIHDYAAQHQLTWVEDETNTDPKYLRNKVRNALKSVDEEGINNIATRLQLLEDNNNLLETEIANMLQYRCRGKSIVSRSWFVLLPNVIATEIIHTILGRVKIRNIDSEKVERLTVAAKVAKPGSVHDIDKSTVMIITKRSARFVDRHTLKAHKI